MKKIKTALISVSDKRDLKPLLNVLKKNIIFDKDYWKITGSHDGYLRKFGTIHEREIEFYPEQNKFIGHDKI